MAAKGNFVAYVERQRLRGQLILQPRMGFSDGGEMRRGLEAVRDFPGATIGTITLDSYTRLGRFLDASQAMARGDVLNGYPIVSRTTEENKALLAGLEGAGFPVQVRHGSPQPFEIFQALLAAGLDATEGGPISYCLPYSRVPLRHSIAAWRQCCRLLADRAGERGVQCHVESFGGCMMGQLCPPALLVAFTVLEALFFLDCGIPSVSLSYAQGTSLAQDLGALQALRQLGRMLLPGRDWHMVLYTFMGKFPETASGARRLIEDSAALAQWAGVERLIIKTAVEARRIPTIEDNLEALGWAGAAAERARHAGTAADAEGHFEQVFEQAHGIIQAVLNLSGQLDAALAKAFACGLLDVPYCLHPDVQRGVSAWVGPDGVIQWEAVGKVPLPAWAGSGAARVRPKGHSSATFLAMLDFNKTKYDLIACP